MYMLCLVDKYVYIYSYNIPSPSIELLDLCLCPRTNEVVLCQTTELLPVDRTDKCIDANVANNIPCTKWFQKNPQPRSLCFTK